MDSTQTTLQTIPKDCSNQNKGQTASSTNLITAEKKSEIISQEITRDAKAASKAGRQKKPRFKWTEEREMKFMHALNLLGIDNAKPSKIMELMDEPGMCRKHVSSHLQKIKNENRTLAQNGMNQNRNHLINPGFIARTFNFFRNQAMESGNIVHPYYMPNAISNLPEIKKEHWATTGNVMNENKNHLINPSFMASNFNCLRNQATESSISVHPYYKPNAISNLPEIKKEHWATAGNVMNENKNHLINPSFMASNFNRLRNQATESSISVHPYYMPNAISNLPEIKKEHWATAGNVMNENKNHLINPSFMASNFNCLRNQAMESSISVHPYYMPNAMSNFHLTASQSSNGNIQGYEDVASKTFCGS